jgi:hypothetical protein
LKGWQLSGTLFARSGLPYTVLNSGTSAGLGAFNYQSPAFANYDGPSSTPHCNSPSSVSSGPCLSPSLFPDIAAGGINGPGAGQLLSGTMNQRRNQFFGPHYFDTDMTIMKYTQIPHWDGAGRYSRKAFNTNRLWSAHLRYCSANGIARSWFRRR